MKNATKSSGRDLLFTSVKISPLNLILRLVFQATTLLLLTINAHASGMEKVERPALNDTSRAQYQLYLDDLASANALDEALSFESEEWRSYESRATIVTIPALADKISGGAPSPGIQVTNNRNTGCSDGFIDGFETGSLQPEWTQVNGSYLIDVNDNDPATGMYSLEISGVSSHYQGLTRSFAPFQPTQMSWWIKPKNPGSNTNYVVVGENVSNTQGISFSYYHSSARIRFYAGQNNDLRISVNPDVWYFMELRNIDYDNKEYDIYVDEILIQSDFPFRSQSSSNVSEIHLYNFSGSLNANYDEIDIDYKPTGEEQVWYEDVDDDGYTSGNTDLSCTQLSGYKTFVQLTGVSCTDLFSDGFESGDLSAWTSVSPFTGYSDKSLTCNIPVGVVSSLQSVPGADEIVPNTGAFFYGEKNPDGCLDAQLNQEIVIPTGVPAKMSFYYTMMYDAGAQTGNQNLGIHISVRPSGGNFETIYEGEEIDVGAQSTRLSDTWHRVDLDLSSYAGGMLTIRIEYLHADFPIQYGFDDATFEHCTLELDCNDDDDSIHPGAIEICNGIDDNCNSDVDEGLSMTWYIDSDMDGFGDSSVSKDTCAMPAGFVANMSDCDDTDPNIHPNAVEICDGIDNNCDTEIDLDDDDLVDMEVPDPSCKDTTVFLDGSGMATLNPSDLDDGSSDNCGIDEFALSQSDFTCSNLGDNAVTLIVTDVNGNVDSCTSIVTIEQLTSNTTPVITGPQTVCIGLSGIPYQATSIPNAISYQWSYTGTGVFFNNNDGLQITLDFTDDATTGSLVVTPHYACGEGAEVGELMITIGEEEICSNFNCNTPVGQLDVVIEIAEVPGDLDIFSAEQVIRSTAAIPPDRNIYFKAGDAIFLENGFEVDQTSSFTAEIGNCQSITSLLNQSKKETNDH